MQHMTFTSNAAGFSNRKPYMVSRLYEAHGFPQMKHMVFIPNEAHGFHPKCRTSFPHQTQCIVFTSYGIHGFHIKSCKLFSQQLLFMVFTSNAIHSFCVHPAMSQHHRYRYFLVLSHSLSNCYRQTRVGELHIKTWTLANLKQKHFMKHPYFPTLKKKPHCTIIRLKLNKPPRDTERIANRTDPDQTLL